MWCLQKPESSGSPLIKNTTLFILLQYQSVTDRRTDRRTDGRTDVSAWLYTSACIYSLLCYRAGKKLVDIFAKVIVKNKKARFWITVLCWLPDTSATRHFGIKTLWDTSAPVSRHFDTSAVIKEKPGQFDPGQFQWDTAPPVNRLKLRHQFCGAEVSKSVLIPKCLMAEVSGSRLDLMLSRQATSSKFL